MILFITPRLKSPSRNILCVCFQSATCSTVRIQLKTSQTHEFSGFRRGAIGISFHFRRWFCSIVVSSWRVSCPVGIWPFKMGRLHSLEMFWNTPIDRRKYPRKTKTCSYLVSSKSRLTLSKPRRDMSLKTVNWWNKINSSVVYQDLTFQQWNW
jgi:hypothetical protein